MSAWAITVLVLLMLGLFGRIVFGLLRWSLPGWTRWEIAAFSWGLGAGTAALSSTISVALGGPTALEMGPGLLAGAVAALAVGAWLIGRRDRRRAGSPPPPPPSPSPALDRWLALFIAIGLTASVASAIALPLQRHDAVAYNGMKAKLLHHDRDLLSEGFTDPDRPHFHRKYPPLVPLLEAEITTQIGEWDDRRMKAIFPLFLAMTLALVLGAQAAFASRTHALLFTALLALVPLVAFDRAGGGTGLSDLPFGFYLTAAAIAVVPGYTEGRVRFFLLGGVLTGLALLTKREGSILAASSLLALLLLGVPACRRGHARFFAVSTLLWLAGLILVAAPWLVVRSRLGEPDYGDTIWYLQSLTPDRLPVLAGRLLPLAGGALREWLRFDRWLLLWPTIALAVGFVAVRRWRRPAPGPVDGAWPRPAGIDYLLLVWMLQLGAYLFVYWTTPNHMPWQMSVSWPRLLIHIFPLGIYLASFAFAQVADVSTLVGAWKEGGGDGGPAAPDGGPERG